MKPYHKNPRRISDKQEKDLSTWLSELGDLSGIVHDLNSNEIIGGNQRSRIFDINNCEIVITERNDFPDKQGTVALGYIVWQGNKYAYRQVRWSERQAEQANIVANRAGGDWDLEILTTNFEVADLTAWGFSVGELGKIGRGNNPEDEWVGMPEFEQKDTFGAVLTVKVHFASEEAMEEFSEFVGQELTLKSTFIWYPKQENADLKVYQVLDES